MMLSIMLRMLIMHGMLSAVRVRLLSACVVVAMLMSTELSVRMLVAVLAGAVVHIIWRRSVDLNGGMMCAGRFFGHFRLLLLALGPKCGEGNRPGAGY
jgi:hypothetical protein